MINIRVNEDKLEYDIYTLFKAFLKNEEINITNTDKTGDDFSGFDICIEKNSVCCKTIALDESDYIKREEGDFADKSLLKNAMKRCIYLLLSEKYKEELPWGTLTGIRPTKLPMSMISEGKSEEYIRNYLKNTYYVSEDKMNLSIDIAKREKTILDAIDTKNGYSLYIGIPFCPTTCLYCSFTSFPISLWKKRTDEYISTVIKEIDYVADNFNKKTLDTVYIGGGTPTTLEPEQLRYLIEYLKSKLDFSNVKEFTVEAGRPDSITREKLQVLMELGVDRISINPQTMNDNTLNIIGRRHTTEDIITAFSLARECGFDNINMDLILGLPGENLSQVNNTMKRIKELDPESITVHSLAIKRAAKMAEYLNMHPEIECVNTPDMLNATFAGAKAMNMQPYYLYRQKNMAGNYENVGFAKEGHFGIYNILIMEEVQSIIACGAGTVTKRVYGDGRIERCDNVKDVALYISKIEEMIDRKRQLFKD